MKDALRARATVGEVCDALREVWGTYVPTDAVLRAGAVPPPQNHLPKRARYSGSPAAESPAQPT